MRSPLVIVLAAAACSSGGKPRAADPIIAAPTGDPAPATPPSAPAPPPVIPGLDPALVAALGLDGPAAPAAVAADARVRFATLTAQFDEGRDVFVRTLTIRAIAGGAVTTEATVALPVGDELDVTDWVWRTPDEIVLLLRDGTLRRFVGGALEPLARPAPKLFVVKKHTRGSERFARDDGLIATAGGEVWIDHCAWGWRGDDDPCDTAVYVRVWPSATSTSEPPDERPEPTMAAAPGWTLAVEPMIDRTTGTLICQGPGGVDGRHEPLDDTFGYSADDAAWLSTRPPIQVVKGWAPGMDDAMAGDYLLGACAAPLDSPGYVLGPAGFWALTTTDPDRGNSQGAVVLWHGRVVTRIDDVERLGFAP